MRDTLSISLMAAFLSIGGVVFADPVTCDNTFVGEDLEEPTDWFEGDNWSTGFSPNPSEVVCILNTSGADFVKIFDLSSTHAHARAIWVEEGALLEIYGENTLNLYGDKSGDATIINTYVDGAILVCPPEAGSNGAVLKLHKSISFLASGSTGARRLGLVHSSARIQAASSSGATITIGSGVTLSGFGQVQLPLINNGKVIAQDYGTLKIEAGGSGSGTWAAETSDGHLQVLNTAITGNGKWELTDDADARIEIDVACECLEGNVEVRQGTLDVDANFWTEGLLTLGGQDSKIDVASLRSAKFNIVNACVE